MANKEEEVSKEGFGETQKKGKLGDIAKSQSSVLSDKNADMATLIQKIKMDFNNEYVDIDVPVYGILSMLLQKTPLYCYDHPGLKQICSTAMTDGTHILIDADFLRELDQYDKENSSRELKTTHFLVMHELMHKLFHHVDRMQEFPHHISNIAQDIVINSRIQMDYEEVIPGDNIIATSTFGFKKDDIERSFESQFPIMLDKRREFLKELKNKEGAEMPDEVVDAQVELYKQQMLKSFEDGADRREFFDDIEKFGRTNEENVARILMEKFKDELEGQNDPCEKGQGQGQGQSEDQGESISKEDAEKILEDLEGDSDEEGNSSGASNGMEFDEDVPQKLIDKIIEAMAKKIAKDIEQGKDGEGKDNGGTSEAPDVNEVPDGYQSDGCNSKRNPLSNHKGHTITMRDIRDKLKELGLDYANDLLKIPDNDEDLNEKMEDSKKSITDTIVSAAAKKRALGDKFPGGHCTDFAMEMLNELSEPEINWDEHFKSWLRKLDTNVGGDNDISSYDETHMYNVLEFMQEITGGAFFGEIIPMRNTGDIACIVDTSASMSIDELSIAMSELFGMLKSSDYSPKVLVYMADTSIRNQEPMYLTEENYESEIRNIETNGDGIMILGRGGTDLEVPIDEVLERHGSNIDAIIHFTDFGYYPPKQDFFADKPPVCIVGIENNDGHEFAKKLRDFDDVDVIMIENPAYKNNNEKSNSM